MLLSLQGTPAATQPAILALADGTVFIGNSIGAPGATTGEVVRLIAQGYTNKEIAVQLSLSVKTVETYKARSMGKLGLDSRVDIVRYALEQGWLASE